MQIATMARYQHMMLSAPMVKGVKRKVGYNNDKEQVMYASGRFKNMVLQDRAE